MGGAKVLHEEVDSYTFKATWLVDEWGQWKELTDDQKFKELYKQAEDKLTRAFPHRPTLRPTGAARKNQEKYVPLRWYSCS